ncbi:hypothetical protein D3C81_1867260 [compost metagenome]
MTCGSKVRAGASALAMEKSENLSLTRFLTMGGAWPSASRRVVKAASNTSSSLTQLAKS